jgi:hypothetical protein
MSIQILAPPEPDIAIDAKAACAFRDLVDLARRSTLDFLRAYRTDNEVSAVEQRVTLMMAIDLKRLSHRPVTQYYEAEILRLRELVRQKDLTIQALGKAVAERELAGVR